MSVADSVEFGFFVVRTGLIYGGEEMKLTDEQLQAVRANRGFVHAEGAEDAHDHYVVMSMRVYREMMGVGTAGELAQSLKAIDQGLAGVEAGRTRPFRELLTELDSDG